MHREFSPSEEPAQGALGSCLINVLTHTVHFPRRRVLFPSPQNPIDRCRAPRSRPLRYGGTDGSHTRRWRKPDSNSESHSEKAFQAETDGLHDSSLEETVSSELVSDAGVAAEEFLESIKKAPNPVLPGVLTLKSR